LIYHWKKGCPFSLNGLVDAFHCPLTQRNKVDGLAVARDSKLLNGNVALLSSHVFKLGQVPRHGGREALLSGPCKPLSVNFGRGQRALRSEAEVDSKLSILLQVKMQAPIVTWWFWVIHKTLAFTVALRFWVIRETLRINVALWFWVIHETLRFKAAPQPALIALLPFAPVNTPFVPCVTVRVLFLI
jgi:hypothetical protein